MASEGIPVENIIFVDDLTGRVVGELKNMWIAGRKIEFIPPDGGPVADAVLALATPGSHVEVNGNPPALTDFITIFRKVSR